MSSVLCFGELLLRLSPQLGGQWIRQQSMPVFIGGAELNVATALARWNVPVAYCTALPDHYLSAEIIASVKERGIDTDKIIHGGQRIGTYYLPQGADLKGAGTIYDRAQSSFWNLKPGEIDWNKLLEGISWFHLSAISPALNESVAAVCLEGLQAAAEKGITTSIDLNYRSKLWQYGRQPVEIMPALVQHCQVVMGNIWAAHTMLGTAIDESIHENSSPEKYAAHAEATSLEIKKHFPTCQFVANTFRFDSGDDDIQYFTTLHCDGQPYRSSIYSCHGVADRSGSGDCFMAGLIYGLRKALTAQEIVDFATAAAFGKLQEKGDATAQTVADIWQRAKSNPVS